MLQYKTVIINRLLFFQPMMYHPILCIDGNHAINVSPMKSADDLFNHCYKLMELEAPRITAFQIYYDVRDEQIAMVDTIMMLRIKLGKYNSPERYGYYMQMTKESLQAFIDLYHIKVSMQQN